MPDYVSRVHSEEIDSLFDAILNLQSRGECYRFFEDLFTVPELTSIAQRWDVAKLLDRGVTYSDIAQRLNVSTATISRVNRCLLYGAGGYKLMLDRMKRKEEE